LLGKTTGPSEVTFKNLEHRLQGMAGDGRDLLWRASGFREQGHRSPPEVMEVEFYGIGNIYQGDGFQPRLSHDAIPDLRKISFLERAAGSGAEDQG
jgi:hypothetical protein